MPSYRCTAKLLKEMGIKKPDPLQEDAEDWHANVLRIGPKKLVLFCSTNTLFTCITPPVSRAQIRDLDSIFFPALSAAMRADGFSSTSIDHCIDKYQGMGVSKTYDRSVLGSMTDYLFHIEHIVWHAGGLDRVDFAEVSRTLNALPQVQREFFNASKAFKKSLIRRVV